MFRTDFFEIKSAVASILNSYILSHGRVCIFLCEACIYGSKIKYCSTIFCSIFCNNFCCIHRFLLGRGFSWCSLICSLSLSILRNFQIAFCSNVNHTVICSDLRLGIVSRILCVLSICRLHNISGRISWFISTNVNYFLGLCIFCYILSRLCVLICLGTFRRCILCCNFLNRGFLCRYSLLLFLWKLGCLFRSFFRCSHDFNCIYFQFSGYAHFGLSGNFQLDLISKIFINKLIGLLSAYFSELISNFSWPAERYIIVCKSFRCNLFIIGAKLRAYSCSSLNLKLTSKFSLWCCCRKYQRRKQWKHHKKSHDHCYNFPRSHMPSSFTFPF